MDTAGQDGQVIDRPGIGIGAAARRVALLRDPSWWRLCWRLHGRPVFTATGGALAFDLGVFAMLAVLGVRLSLPWDAALGIEARLMLAALCAFGFLWVSISEPDWRRFGVLRRRWLARSRQAPVPLPHAGPVRTWHEPPAAPMPRVRSVYRPQRGSLSSHWAWRVGPRGR